MATVWGVSGWCWALPPSGRKGVLHAILEAPKIKGAHPTRHRETESKELVRRGARGMPSLPREPCSESGCHTATPACGKEGNPTAASRSPKDSPSVWPSPEQPQRILPQSGWMPLQAKSRLPSFCGVAGEGEIHPSSRMLLCGKGTGTNQMEEGKPGMQIR